MREKCEELSCDEERDLVACGPHGTWQGGARCLAPVVGCAHVAIRVRPVEVRLNQQ